MLTASLVIYHNNEKKLEQTLSSFLQISGKKKLYVIDNSLTNDLERLFKHKDVIYLHTQQNLGFGRGHNYILDDIKAERSQYHLILNPDVYFDEQVVPLLIQGMKQFEKVGLIGPKIEYPNGEFQLSIRRFPKPQDLFIRRISTLRKLFKTRFDKSHYLDKNLSRPRMVDSIAGCFQLFKTDVYLEINGFDERYFMYMEDIDICKKVIANGQKILFYPYSKATHYYEKGSTKNFRLLIAHINSSIKYFMKWGLYQALNGKKQQYEREFE